MTPLDSNQTSAEDAAAQQAQVAGRGAEASDQDLDSVAGGHIDETTSIWHDIGTGLRAAYDGIVGLFN